MAPAAAFLTWLACFGQTGTHLLKIRAGVNARHHDQVCQILALPAVYGVMSMSALTRLYQLHVQHFVDDADANAMSHKQQEDLALSRSETCFLVADLFEAWALYHFGKLTLEVIEASIKRQGYETDLERRAEAKGMMTSHSAVEALVWAGIMIFLLVCFCEAGWSLYLLTFASDVQSNEDYDSSMSWWTAAGFVASTAAIWNVAVVEHVFHENLSGYSPLLKFITVKILVSFAYFQECVWYGLVELEATLPAATRGLVRKVPFFGDLLNLTDAQFKLFYSSLLVLECLLVATMHWVAWSAKEDWYDLTGKLDETTPLKIDTKAGSGAVKS
eukprot:gb/GFBE01022138.1/.p1 GENE.gb/GFBE01022138.1/~~gb/GFBE01022138.1/.p1  ORF type:complete len:330 (+),score=69.74 gb/GFBE01022138.1/:1-990(+)